MRLWLVLSTLVLTSPADAHVLRLATVVPEGTGWAREGRAFARDVEQVTQGRVQIKWYLGAIAGDEGEVKERIERGQLDGAAFSMQCYRLSPTMRVARVIGLLQNRDEAAYVMGRLKPDIDAELAQHGYANLFEAGVGSDMMFSRGPARTLAELKQKSHWIWDLDDTLRAQLDALGFHTVALPITDAARAFDQGRSDGFLAVPTAALAFQWSTQAAHLVPLRIAYVEGCLVVANRAFDALSPEDQAAVRAAAAKLQARFEDLGRAQDEALIGGLFARQGVTIEPVTDALKSDLFAAAGAVREQLGARLVPAATLARVQALLADFRAEHAGMR